MEELRIKRDEKKTEPAGLWVHEYRTLFLIGCVLGLISFVLVYGIRVLDFTYDAWLLNGDMDLRQHYIGWCHFRMDAWQFPVGLIYSLSYPTSMSVIYTDSIPLFALLFKPFTSILPETFQYFGLFGILSFALQGGISVLLIRRFTDKKWLCIVSALFFILSFPVLSRMYYHTALGAQWLLLLALLLWFYQDSLGGLLKRCMIWAGMGFLCVSIHSYFLPMVGLILLASIAERWVIGNKTGSRRLGLLRESFFLLFFYCLTALVMLFVLGAFYGSTSAAGEGLGSFGSNLNTFINSLGEGRIFPAMPLYYDFQYEGAGYLGAGILLLLCALGILFVKNVIIIPYVQHGANCGSSAHDFRGKADQLKIRKFFIEHYRIAIILLLFAAFCVLSVFPIVAWNDTKLFGVPYPAVVRKVLSIFRSNGRFIWTAVYLVILSAVIFTDRYFSPRLSGVLIAAALSLQLFDLSGIIEEKRNYFNTPQTYETMWDAEELKEVLQGHKEFVFLYDENDILMETAYYAYLHEMQLNNYYYARDIADAVENNISRWKKELKAGVVKEWTIYIFKEEGFDAADYRGMDFYYMNGHVIGTKKGQLPF
ncbi:MAG: DUF6311 domain-containing protein [Lachnospiraceae bacterium]